MARASRKKVTSPTEPGLMSYSQLLEERLRFDPPKRKGERTRTRLKAAAARVLEQSGYLDMRVSDVCDAVDAGFATFYRYFDNKSDITREVLIDFLDEIGATRAPPDAGASVFDSMVATNLHFMRSFEVNSGLMRCLLQFSDETPEFIQLWQARGHEWYKRIAHRMLSEAKGPEKNEQLMLLTTYALGGMMDQMFRDLYVHRNQPLLDLVAEVAPSTEELSRLLALIWYRGAFGRDPA